MNKLNSAALGLAFAGALTFVMAAPTSAASLKDEVFAPVYSWDGFYAGVNAGWAWTDTDASIFIPGTSNIGGAARTIAEGALVGNVDGDGFTGGITLGVNRQTGNIVYGIEGDFNLLDLDETRDSGIVASGGATGRGQDRVEADWLATIRLRLGIATDQSLFYITGGAAFTDAEVTRTLDWSFADGCTAVGGGLQRCHAGNNDFNFGWTIGGGVEHAFSPDWTIKAEYLYADFGDANFQTLNSGPVVANQTMNHSFDLTMHILRVGINYKFGAMPVE